MSKKTIRITESQLKEIINDKLAQSYGGDSHSFPSGGGQWNTVEGEENGEEMLGDPTEDDSDLTEQERNILMRKLYNLVSEILDKGYFRKNKLLDEISKMINSSTKWSMLNY